MELAAFGAARGDFEFSILATEISTRVLETAARGIYPEERITPVAPALRTKYLLRGRDGSRGLIRVAPELRQRIRFERLNFMDARYEPGVVFDVIFFRNVMIYFDKPTQEAVIRKLCAHLRPGGYLFVGHSESLAGLSIPVECIETAVYRKPS
jgi:chemotaxis protein methyltransferase CheR